MKHTIKILVLSISFCGILSAQQPSKAEILDSVLIDSKTLLPRKNSSKVVSKITEETLEKTPGKSIASIINEVSGIEINGAHSNDGQNLGYYVRGGRNRQVVIMVDGVQLNDPSQIANDFDLRLISTSSIESIEIVKGASSVLYGSGAATAVISITTKKPSERPITALVTSTFGSNRPTENEGYNLEEYTNSVSVNGTLQQFFYQMDFANRYVDGLSSVAAREGEALFESDIFNRYNGKMNLGYHFTKNIQLSRFFSFDKFKSDFDNFGYTDADFRSISKQFRTGGNFQWKYIKGIFVLNDNYTWLERDVSNSSFPEKYDSKSSTLDAYINHKITTQLSLLAGLNFNESRFNSFSIPFGETDFTQSVDEKTANFKIIDPYLNAVYISNFGLNINAGARLNTHSLYDNHFLYNLNPSYNLELGVANLKILGSYSTAYITPSLFQIYAPLYGNENLQPEENTTIEGGLEFSTENNLRISAVYFTRNEKNYIDFVTIDPELFISQYQNISEEFTANGVEVEFSKRIGTKFNISGNYTYTQPDEKFALRIPKHKANAQMGYSITSKTQAGLSYHYTGQRDDIYFNPITFEAETVTLESYGLMDLSFSTQLSENLKLFANVANVFDEEYEEIYRFQTRGRNVRVGFSLGF